MYPKDLVVIDFETEMTADRFDVPFPVEVGAVRLRAKDLSIRGTFHSLVRPPILKSGMRQRSVDDKGDPLDPTLADILNEDLDNAPEWADVLPDLDSFAKGAMMAAWPITFERPVLDKASRGLTNHYHFGRRWLDIGSVCYAWCAARGIFTTQGNAPNIARILNVPISDPKPHRGLPDALFEAELLRAVTCRIMQKNYRPPSVWERADGTPTSEPWAGLPIVTEPRGGCC